MRLCASWAIDTLIVLHLAREMLGRHALMPPCRHYKALLRRSEYARLPIPLTTARPSLFEKFASSLRRFNCRQARRERLVRLGAKIGWASNLAQQEAT